MKKVLALALAATMALGMTVTSFAADKTLKYRNFAPGYTLAYDVDGPGTLTDQTFDMGTFHPDEQKVKMGLDHDMFLTPTDYTGPGVVGSSRLTSADIRNAKMAVRTTARAGSKLLDSVKIENKDGEVVAKFVKELIATKGAEFEILVYITMDGKRFDDQGLTLIGEVKNEEIEVYENYDYVDTSAGYVAVAEEFVNKIEVDLGNGVSIFTKFFKGKKYYGTSTRDADEADDVVFKKYPDIDNVVTLKTVGLNSTGDIVKLDNDYDAYFVYDKDMNYLGKSNEMLPYSTKYYLANKELNVGDDDDGDPEEEGGVPTTEGENPASGGDGETTPNANKNPGTGR